MFKSLECNRWLDEEPYEQSDFFPAAQVTTLGTAQVDGVAECSVNAGSLCHLYLQFTNLMSKQVLILRS